MTENKLICPFCQQELRQDQDGFYTCYTDNCGCMSFGGNGASGSESLWQALIDTKNKLDDLSDKNGKLETELERTRKALDVAVDALKEITNNDYDADWQNDIAQATLEKIKDIR